MRTRVCSAPGCVPRHGAHSPENSAMWFHGISTYVIGFIFLVNTYVLRNFYVHSTVLASLETTVRSLPSLWEALMNPRQTLRCDKRVGSMWMLWGPPSGFGCPASISPHSAPQFSWEGTFPPTAWPVAIHCPSPPSVEAREADSRMLVGTRSIAGPRSGPGISVNDLKMVDHLLVAMMMARRLTQPYLDWAAPGRGSDPGPGIWECFQDTSLQFVQSLIFCLIFTGKVSFSLYSWAWI